MKKYIFIFSVIAITISSCSKEEGEGGRSSISGAIEGTEISVSRAEVTEITVVPGHEIKGQDFFFLNTPLGNDNYAVWFRDLGNITNAPSFTDRVLIKVDYSRGSSSNIDVAAGIETALNAISGSPFSVNSVEDIITVSSNINGATPDADNGISKLGMDVLVQGRDKITLQSGAFADEDVFIIYGDEDDIYDDNIKTNFDGTFKFNNLREGSYKIFAYNEDESLTNPLIPIFESIEIGGNEDADIGTITIEKK